MYLEQFVAIADYVPVDDVEMGLREGDIVEVLKTGSTGWCLAHHLTTNEEGWVPGTYLDPVPNTGSRSYVSMSSIGKTDTVIAWITFDFLNSGKLCCQATALV